jgi:hypothetical protein
MWMYDHEYGADEELKKIVKMLAHAWRTILKQEDKELGIDEEFTRAGVECLLDQLKDSFESCEYVLAEFNWRP